MALASISGWMVLPACLLAARESFISLQDTLWAMGAGVSGALGSAVLYRALAVGEAATVAPTAAVMGAGLSACFGMVVQGWPNVAQLVGFGVALAGIWLVSQSTLPGKGRPADGVGLACLSRLGSSGFFIFPAQIDLGGLFAPLLLVRSTALVMSLGLLVFLMRRVRWPRSAQAGGRC